MEPGRRSVLGSALALGTNMVAGMALFTFLGYKVDQRRGGGRTCTLIGMFLGLFYGGYEVWKLVRQIQAAAGESSRVDP
jgi:hypothetical protein